MKRNEVYKIWISIHVPRVEDDTLIVFARRLINHFNPRPPCGGRREI